MQAPRHATQIRPCGLNHLEGAGWFDWVKEKYQKAKEAVKHVVHKVTGAYNKGKEIHDKAKEVYEKHGKTLEAVAQHVPVVAKALEKGKEIYDKAEQYHQKGKDWYDKGKAVYETHRARWVWWTTRWTRP